MTFAKGRPKRVDELLLYIGAKWVLAASSLVPCITVAAPPPALILSLSSKIPSQFMMKPSPPLVFHKAIVGVGRLRKVGESQQRELRPASIELRPLSSHYGQAQISRCSILDPPKVKCFWRFPMATYDCDAEAPSEISVRGSTQSQSRRRAPK